MNKLISTKINFSMINIIDLHNDYFVEIKQYKKKCKYLSSAMKNGVKNICSAVWTTEMSEQVAFKTINECAEFSKKHNIFYSVEDLHFINESNINTLIEINPKLVNLTWNDENNLAGGALSNGDISSLGKNIIKTLENNNIQIDTAHLNEKSFLTFSSITTKPLICSHTAFYTKCEHPRNLKDYQLKIIAESGGLVGICLVSRFLHSEKKVTISDFVSQIDYYVSNYGIDTIALGTDFYGTKDYPKGIKYYKDLIKVQNRLELLGYTQNAIEKIFYKNAERFLNFK